MVATTRAIQDSVAAEFAKTFYAELAARPLREAFDTAVQAIRLRRGGDPRSVTRDLAVPEEAEAPRWPWVIDCDPAYEAWTLGAASGGTWWARLLLAVGVMLLVGTVSLAASAGARRTACRARGLRSLCAAVGVGDVPTPAEQALWDEARKQSSGDGLRAYLRRYPEGAYADEGRARLAGCTIERVETLGPGRDVRFALTVSQTRARPLPTEDEARRDAVVRGNRDAADTCEPMRLKADLVSALAEPHEWSCTQLDPGFACGFDGEIVCRVRDRIATDHERCRDEDR